MRGAHEGFQLLWRGGARSNSNSPLVSSAVWFSRFHAKQFLHGQVAKIVLIALLHERFRLRAANSASGSRKPTVKLRHGNTMLAQLKPERATVAGGSRRSSE